MPVWSFYEGATGRLIGQSFTGPEGMLEPNTPQGCVALPGDHDHMSKRVDLATGEVVDWQPPKPADTPTKVHAWDGATRRWAAAPTLEGRRAPLRELVHRKITSIELEQLRPLRELALLPAGPARAAALAALQVIEVRIEAQRGKLDAINAATTLAELEGIAL